MKYYIALEIVSLMFIIVLAFFNHEQKVGKNQRYFLYSFCLLSSGVTTFLNIISAYVVNYNISIPLWQHMTLHTGYYLSQYLMVAIMGVYGFSILSAYTAGRYTFAFEIKIIKLSFLLFTGLILGNVWNGWFFEIQNGVYVQGPFSRAGYILLGVGFAVLYVAYLRVRGMFAKDVRMMLRVIPLLFVILVIYQVMHPEILLLGTISFFMNWFHFIAFQSSRNGQDFLSGLPNRYSFLEEADYNLIKNKRLHLVMLRFNDFGKINHKYGVMTGDAVIYAIGRYLDELSPHYRAFRFSNTRFLLVGDGTVSTREDGRSVMNMLVNTIQARFEEPWKAEGNEVHVRIKIVHMVSDMENEDRNSILERLEYIQAYSKEIKSAVPVFFDERMKEKLEREKYVLEQVRRAIEKESFEVYYQPIYDCKAETFVTAESLLRMFDENGNFISPGEFIPLAEENGLLDDISWIVLKKVCQFIGEHPQLPLKSISINMSMQQLTDKSFFNRIYDSQALYGVSLEQLKIEITERTVSEDLKGTQSIINQLYNKGVGFYMDDFGVGYSNFAGMMQMPFETIKLDMSLIKGIHSSGGYDMVWHLVQMMHNAGFLVVAEGVEDEDEVMKVKELEIDRIQGYYYARPMTGDALTEFLR